MFKNVGIMLFGIVAGAYAQKNGWVEKIIDFGKKCAVSIKEKDKDIVEEEATE